MAAVPEADPLATPRPTDPAISSWVRAAAALEAVARHPTTPDDATRDESTLAKLAYLNAVPTTVVGIAAKLASLTNALENAVAHGWPVEAEQLPLVAESMLSDARTVLRAIRRGVLGPVDGASADAAVAAERRHATAMAAVRFLARRSLGASCAPNLDSALDERSAADEAFRAAVPSTPAGFIVKLEEVAGILDAIARGELPLSKAAMLMILRHLNTVTAGLRKASDKK